MFRIVFFIVFLALFGALFPATKVWAANSAYNVRGVQVDVLDQSAVKARNKAFAEAQKKAFAILVSRFETPEDGAPKKVPDDKVLSGLIQDFEITSEQLSTKRYRGVFSFQFKPGAVNRYFGHGPVNYQGESGVDKRRVLIVPFYQEGNKAPVFDKRQNPYLTSLKAELPKDGNILLTEGNISDMTDIGGKDPHQLSGAAIRRLKARYEAQDVMLAIAHVDLKNPQTTRLEMLRTDRAQVSVMGNMNVSPLQIAKATFEIAQMPHSENYTDRELDPESPQALQSEESSGGEAVTTGVPPQSTTMSAENKTIPATQLQPAGVNTKAGEIAVKVFITSMQEWLSIQRQLSTIMGGKGVRITSLKTNQVDIVVGYTDWDRFTNNLRRSGFALEPQSTPNAYILKRQSIGY